MTLDLENRGLIGRGAHGSVWLVYDRGQRRHLALKIVSCTTEADARRLLADAAQFSSGKPNPWLLPWEDFGFGAEAPEGVRQAFPEGLAGPFIWLLMRYVHGPSALELAQANPRFGWAEAMALGTQVAERLARRPPGQAHLDLKPENVLIELDGDVFLVDGHLGTPAGSSAYASPEQRTAGATPGPAADTFALGRMLRRLTARQFPGPGATPDLVPPWPEPRTTLAPEQRRLCRSFAELVDTLTLPGPEERPEMAGIASEFFKMSVGFSAANERAVLADSIRNASPIARLQQPLEDPAAPAAASPPLLQDNPDAAPKPVPHRSRPYLQLSAVALALASAGLFTWHNHQPPPAATPAPDPALRPFGEGVFTDDAPHRKGGAVPIGEDDKIPWERALFGLQLPFRAVRISILNRNLEPLDSIESTATNKIYRWDVEPGIFYYRIERHRYGPDTEPVELGPKSKLLVKPRPYIESAPMPEPSTPPSK